MITQKTKYILLSILFFLFGIAFCSYLTTSRQQYKLDANEVYAFQSEVRLFDQNPQAWQYLTGFASPAEELLTIEHNRL